MGENETKRGGKVLVIDDDLTITDLIKTVLGRDGYQVYVANSGHQGIALARQVGPNLILMDIMMPDLDGYEATKQLKADPRLHAVPVIFLTGRSPSEDGGRAFATGGLAYMRKPFTNVQLKDLVGLAMQSIKVA